MKTNRRPRFAGLDAQSASGLAKMLNEFFDDHQGERIEVTYCFEHGMSAVLSWEEETKVPESLREEYELRGECYTCEDCDKRLPSMDGRTRCEWYCLRRPRGTDLTAPACNNFYLEMEGENGEG